MNLNMHKPFILNQKVMIY